jgi:thiamine pyrophosphate-dependent acetolactate synthase large subunit-like protein
VNRQDVIQTILESVDDQAVIVASLADTSFELYMLGDRPRNFYMLGSFGLAPSIALGIALSRPDRVIAIDGDGALLYNLGCLATEGRYAPPNYLHVVVDNGAHGATGYQPTATAGCADLAAVAAGCGLRARTVADLAGLRQALGEALAGGGPQVIVAEARERPLVAAPLPSLAAGVIRGRFTAALGTG